MPNSKILVDTTQRLLPVKPKAELVREAMEEDVEAILPRVEGGMMSTSAATRSRSDSDVCTSRSEATEISESGECVVWLASGFDGKIAVFFVFA